MQIRELDVPSSENRFKHVALAALHRALSTSTDFSSSLHLFHISFLSITACVNCTASLSIAFELFTPFHTASAPSLLYLCGNIPNGGRSASSWLRPRASSIRSLNVSLLRKQV